MHRRQAEMLSRAAVSADDLQAVAVTLRRLERFWNRAADLVQRPQPLAPGSSSYAESFDEGAGRYRGLRCGQVVNISEDNLMGLLVRPEVALK